MGKQDNQPPPFGSGETKPAAEVLSSVIQELELFHRQIKDQFSQDIQRLQADKSRLMDEIEQLRQEHQQLQSQQVQSLSQRLQEQAWQKQLAQIVADNIQQELLNRIRQLRGSISQPLLGDQGGLIPSSERDLSDRELEAVLDTSLNQTFQDLQQELSTYQSGLSQRLSNLQSLEQQVEALLEAVVLRMREQLDSTSRLPHEERRELSSSRRESLPPSGALVPEKVSQPQPKPASQVQIGLLLALLSAVSLSLFNVCLKIILKGPNPRQIFGLFEIEGVITPGLGNSLLILLFRMIVVMALMPILATFLYPAVWSDLRRFLQSGDRGLTLTVIGSGFFLFLSQVAIYIAIGEIPTGIAITIFFIYPIVTVLASWGLFGDQPTLIRAGAMALILAGGILSLPNFFKGAAGNTQLGVIAAVCAGIAFAGYVLLTQVAAGKLHPIPFSLVNFAAIFVFSSVSLMLIPDGLGLDVDPNNWTGLIIGGLVLGVLTLFSYLLNNFAIRSAGASLASIIGTSGPALTALFAFLIIGEALTTKQISGMLLVILGVAAMSVERMIAPKKKPA